MLKILGGLLPARMCKTPPLNKRASLTAVSFHKIKTDINLATGKREQGNKEVTNPLTQMENLGNTK